MITVRVDTRKFTKAMNDLEKKQVPFATALALTRLGQVAKTKEQRAMPRVFNTPTRWTVNSPYATRVKKKNPFLEFGFKAWDDKGVAAGRYLEAQIFGRAKKPTRLDSLFRNRRESFGSNLLGQNQFVTPGAKMRYDGKGSMASGFLQKVLSAVRAQNDNAQNTKQTSNQALFWGRSKGGKGALGVYRRKGRTRYRKGKKGAKGTYRGGKLEPILKVTNRRPTYRKRYPFFENMSATVEKNFDYQFRRAMKTALKTAKP